MAGGLKALGAAFAKSRAFPAKDVSLYLVHRAARTPATSSALVPGVKALELSTFIASILGDA